MSGGSLSGSHSAAAGVGGRHTTAAASSGAGAVGPQRPSSLPVCRDVPQHRA